MKIEYNIVSKGTERDSNSNGYMAVTEITGGKRYILPISHSIQSVESLTKDYLFVDYQLPISSIAVARFALISKLVLERQNFNKNKNILVCGCGCVGYALLFNLWSMGYKNVTFTSLKEFNLQFYNWQSPCSINYNNFDIIFDATGNNDVLETIFEKCKYMATIVLVGTPRHLPNVNLLQIHRKNLIVIGSHELFGYSGTERQNAFQEITNYMEKNKCDFSDVCEIVDNKNFNDEKIYQIIRRTANDKV